MLLTCKKDLTVFSSNRFFCHLLKKGKLLDYLPTILRKEASIKILIEEVDDNLRTQIAFINNSSQTRPILLGYINKIGELDEMIIIFDNNHLLHINYDPNNKLISTYSNEEHKVLIQEGMFEKHWNELKSLDNIE